MPKSVAFDLESREIREVSFTEATAEGAASLIHWVHLDLNESFAEQATRMGLKPEEIHKVANCGTQPEMSEHEDGLLLVLPYWSPEESDSVRSHLVIHIGPRHCLTASDRPLPAIAAFDASYKLEFRYAQSPGFILFLVLDYLIEDFGAMVGRLDEEGQAFDDRILGALDQDLNRDILAFKRRVVTLKRVVGHTRAIIGRIASRRIVVITEACRASLGDIGNEAQAVLTSVESLRDMADSSFESYRSELAQRLNEIMKVLTMVSLAILPMTLIAGIYGMNFDPGSSPWNMPELRWHHGYPIALGLMLISAVAILGYFKKKGWL